MRMRLNEVLECANKAIDEIREGKGIMAKGHFVSTTEIRKSMGPYRQCDVRIVYVNLDEHKTIDFCTTSAMERCTIEDEKKLVKATEMKALKAFFTQQCITEIWQQIIGGEYGVK